MSCSNLSCLRYQKRHVTWQQQQQQRKRSRLHCPLQVVVLALAAGALAEPPRLHQHRALHVCWQLPSRATLLLLWLQLLRLSLALLCSSKAVQQLGMSSQQQQEQVMVMSAWVRMQEIFWRLRQQMQHVQRQQLPAGWQRSPHRLASRVQVQLQV
jgi:hypothetical protein